MRIFFNFVSILIQKSLGIKNIQNQFNFKIFDHEKGSYTNIFDNEVFSSQVPNPTYDKKINLSEVFKKILTKEFCPKG